MVCMEKGLAAVEVTTSKIKRTIDSGWQPTAPDVRRTHGIHVAIAGEEGEEEEEDGMECFAFG